MLREKGIYLFSAYQTAESPNVACVSDTPRRSVRAFSAPVVTARTFCGRACVMQDTLTFQEFE